MKPGDLVTPKGVGLSMWDDTSNGLSIWDDTGNVAVGKVESGDVCLVVEKGTDTILIRILSPAGLGWIHKGYMQVISEAG